MRTNLLRRRAVISQAVPISRRGYAFSQSAGTRGSRQADGGRGPARSGASARRASRGADKVEAREAATASLIKLGPKVLPLLPDPATIKSAERKERLGRVRAALRTKDEDINPDASRVTLIGQRDPA